MLRQGEVVKEGPWAGYEVIDTYSRAEAIADGGLVDVSTVAREAGIIHPVAVTSVVWGKYVTVPTGVVAQDEKGRLWDILWMLRISFLSDRNKDSSEFQYELRVRNDNRMPRRVFLKAVCEPGDNGEPVITVMLPDED